jgi:hypothetical protein
MTRRRLMAQALAVLPLSACVLPLHSEPSANTVREWMRSLFPNLQAAMTVGRMYLRRWPEENSAAWLAHELFGTGLSDRVDRASEASLMQHVQSASARDFCADDLVTLNGWVVTRTEARMLALLSLCSDK